jgi:hypothetical protein
MMITYHVIVRDEVTLDLHVQEISIDDRISVQTRPAMAAFNVAQRLNYNHTPAEPNRYTLIAVVEMDRYLENKPVQSPE